MASKKNSGKNKNQNKGGKAAKNKKEKAIGMAENLAEEQLATLPPDVEKEALARADKVVPIEEVERELKETAPGEEKAIGMAEEQLATLPPDVEKEALARADKVVPIEEVERELKETAPGEEKAIGMAENLAEEQLATLPPDVEKEALARADKVVPVEEVERELARPAPATTGGAQKPRLPRGISPRPLFAGNPYFPKLATVVEIIKETPTIRTLRVVLDGEGEMADFRFEPGQVGQISVFGAGEATFVINSPPSQKDYLQFSVMKTGEVTDAIHKLNPGDKVGLRAPLGNYFPYNDWKGKNVYFIGGGIGMAPIRTIMYYLLEHAEDYGRISLLYGARSPADMAYSYELDEWTHNPKLHCTLTIDNPHDEWGSRVGLIPSVLEELNPSPENTAAVLCGPPIMIKFTSQALKKLGFQPENIVTTLEKRMKCGIGICGRCNIGDRYVCVDGPVFTLKELEGLPQDY